jgi:hypothetical protein
VGPRAGLDMVKLKFLTILESNSDTLVVQPEATRHTDCATAALERERERREEGNNSKKVNK